MVNTVVNTYSQKGKGAANMITMTQLAKLAGVSQPTVSRVLNGNTSVNPEVVKRVLAIAEEYNYQPNMIARGLNGSRTCLLAVIVPDIANPFFAELTRCIEAEAEESGYSILIFNSEWNPQKERKYLNILQRYRVDGLILAPVSCSEEHLKPFMELTIPWTLITNHAKKVDSIYVDHRKAGRMMAEHMLSVGAKRFIFVGGTNDDKMLGYRQELKARGVDVKHHFMTVWERNQQETLSRVVDYVQQQTECTGIFALNDLEALVLMNALTVAGISIPEQAALAGFDNTFISRGVIPGITSVRQPVDQMARLAVKKILQQVSGKVRKRAQYTELEAELIIRSSTQRHSENA